jgi:O-acetyl-ADP-ribose deacetylase (regulator of RNase III)
MTAEYVDASFVLGSVVVRLTSRPLEMIVTQGIFDAVVSSDDSVLSMGGGVSAAIAAAAGSGVKAEVEHLLPASVGDVLVTSGGHLKVRYILHAITVDWANRIFPTRATIRQLAREVLRRCEALEVGRLGVPALATGAAGFSAAESAWLIVQALAEHVQQPTSLEEIQFSLPDQEARIQFEKVLHCFNVPHPRMRGQFESSPIATQPPALEAGGADDEAEEADEPEGASGT